MHRRRKPPKAGSTGEVLGARLQANSRGKRDFWRKGEAQRDECAGDFSITLIRFPVVLIQATGSIQAEIIVLWHNPPNELTGRKNTV